MATLPVAVLKLAWKFLGPAITTLVLKLGEEGFQALRLMLKTRQEERRGQAQARAQAAQDLARQARDPGDAQRYATQAEVWREVANQYAEDNKALAEELDTLKRQMADKSVRSVQALGAPRGSGAHASPGTPGERGQTDIDQHKQ